jgi:putative transposase
MVEPTMELLDWFRKKVEQADGDVLQEMLHIFAETLMDADASAACNAGFNEKSPERTNTRNGYRSRAWDTRAGTIDLAVPKLRQGSYFPSWLLEPRRRAEKALVAVVADCYLAGVSTRRVDKLVKTLGIEGISKSQVSKMAKSLDEMVESFRNRPLDAGPYAYLWLDALVQKSREGGRIVNVATLTAIGVNADGHREVLGVDVVTSEDGAGWLDFLRGLKARGLSGVALITSDAHPGLKDAIAATFPGAVWQRCRTHFMRNLLCRVPKASQDLVATVVRSIFAQPDADCVRAQHEQVVEQLEAKFSDAARLLSEAEDEILAFASFPKEHWRQIWSNNPLERLNREIRRRTDVVGIFPNRAAVIRLVGAVLAEQHDEWQVARRYMSRESLEKVNNILLEVEEVRAALPMASQVSW